MATIEERVTAVERDVENEQEWRRAMVEEMRAGFQRLETKIDTNQRWLIGLMVGTMVGVAGLTATIVKLLG